MTDFLHIPPAGALDLLSLGALVHRLDPGIIPFRKATECQIHVSGGEFNCAANLADCFCLQSGIATAMVDYPIGDLIAERVRAMGVKPFYKHFKHNGVNDLDRGVMDRFLVTPVSRPAIIVGRMIQVAVVTIVQATILIVLGMILGAGYTNFVGVLTLIVLAILVALPFAALSNGLGLLLRQEESVIGANQFILLPLT